MAAGAQDIKDRIGTAPVRHAWATATKAVGSDMHWQERLQDSPERIRHAKAGGGRVIWGARACARQGCLGLHNEIVYHTGLFG